MPSLSKARASNALFSPSYIPTAVFVGGTSGIGQGMVERFAAFTNGNANIIICGRNREAAEKIIASLPKPSVAPEGKAPVHEFVQCDATLMKNVDVATHDLLSRLPSVNFLVLTAGFLSMKGRDETEEGLDRKLAVHYYSRWKFTRDLMPLLRKAKDEGEDAKVISVMAAGHGGEIDLNDLGLKTTFSVPNAALAAPTYNDLMLEEFSRQQPDLAFTHAAPGAVNTQLFSNLHWSLKPVGILFSPLLTSPSACGEYMWWGVFDGKQGVFRRGSNGDSIGTKRYFGSDEARQKLWAHTEAAVSLSK